MTEVEERLDAGYYVSSRGRAGLAPIIDLCYRRRAVYGDDTVPAPRVVLAYSRPAQRTEFGVLCIATSIGPGLRVQSIDVPAHGADAASRALNALYHARCKSRDRDALFVLTHCENVCDPDNRHMEDPEFMHDLQRCINMELPAPQEQQQSPAPEGFHMVVACLGMPPSRMSRANLKVAGARAVYFDEPRESARRQLIVKHLNRHAQVIAQSELLSARFVGLCRADIVEFLVDRSAHHAVGEIEEFFASAWEAMLSKMYDPHGRFIEVAPQERFELDREFYDDLMAGGDQMAIGYSPDKTEDPYREYARIETSEKREFRMREAEEMRSRRKRGNETLGLFSTPEPRGKRSKGKDEEEPETPDDAMHGALMFEDEPDDAQQ